MCRALCELKKKKRQCEAVSQEAERSSNFVSANYTLHVTLAKSLVRFEPQFSQLLLCVMVLSLPVPQSLHL